MTHPKLTKLFVAGTDTDVGKTYTSALLAAWLLQSGRRVGVYKPVASGCIMRDGELVAEDAVAIWEAAGSPLTLAEVCPQRFAQPLAPPEAAAAEGKTVDANLLRTGAEPWEQNFDVLIIEGAGGLFSPLADGVLNIDLAKSLEATLIVIAANRLGVIHQVLATCGAAEHEGLKPRGLFLCSPQDHPDDSVSSNAQQIAKYSDVPILGQVPHGGQQEHIARIAEIIG